MSILFSKKNVYFKYQGIQVVVGLTTLVNILAHAVCITLNVCLVEYLFVENCC